MNLTNLLSIFAAEATNNCVSTAIFGEVCDNCNGSATMQILAYILRAMTYGIGVLAVIGIMAFGIKYLISRGDETLATKARRHLFEVLIGVAVYVVSIFALGWLLPGNLTTTMLGGSPSTCPDVTKTDISVTGGSDDGDDTGSSGGSGSTGTGEGWKSGTRPRECGPGTPGDFQTMTKQKDKDGNNVNVYTTSQGRTYFLFSQGDPRWGSYTGWSCCGSTLAQAGCYETSMAMVMNSYSYSSDYTPRSYSTSDKNVAIEKHLIHERPSNGTIHDKLVEILDSGGAIVTHVNQPGTHWFVIADYRHKNDGQLEYLILDTHGSSDLDWRSPERVEKYMCGISIKNCKGGYSGLMTYLPTKTLECNTR